MKKLLYFLAGFITAVALIVLGGGSANAARLTPQTSPHRHWLNADCLYERYSTVSKCGDYPWNIPVGKEKQTAMPCDYQVKRGDTLWVISVFTYGNGHKWKKIAKANHVKGKTIYVGQTLQLCGRR